MSSKKVVTTKRNSTQPSLPRRPPYRFLTRNLRDFGSNYQVFQKIFIKRLYLNKLIDDRDESLTPEEIPYPPFKHNKLLKTLKYIQVPSVHKSYVHESLKNAKNLKGFGVDSYSNDTSLAKIAFYLKKLPKETQIISLQIFKDDPVPNRDFYKIAKSIRILRKLENFYRWFMLENNRTHVPRELRTYNQSVSRLKKMKKVVYQIGSNEQPGFQRAMRRGFVYPQITGIKIFLSAEELPNYFRLEPYFDPETSHDIDPHSEFEHLTGIEQQTYRMVQDEIRREDEEQGDDLLIFRNALNREIRPRNREAEELDDFGSLTSDTERPIMNLGELFNDDEEEEDFVASCIMREEIKPFFRFDLLPNLKQLRISQEDYLYPLDSFVVDGFAALTKLEELKLNIMSRSMGTSYIFRGFLKLPLLKKFSLNISFIKNQDWDLLQQFLTHQNNLESLQLSTNLEPCTSARFIQQNKYLESTIQCLENKTLLKCLKIRSTYWSLEALSNGLSHLTKMTNQFHTLELEASDETITSQTKPWKRIDGLCQFIKNQSESLKTLRVYLPLVLDDNVVVHVAEAISKMLNLRELSLSLNSCSLIENEELIDYFELTLQSEISVKSRNKLKRSKTWNPSVAKYLKRLQNLEDFTLNFDVANDDSMRWFLDIMKALPSLERLRSVFISTQSGACLLDVEEKVEAALFELENIKLIDMFLFSRDSYSRRMLRGLERTVRDINERQSLRCDLMF